MTGLSKAGQYKSLVYPVLFIVNCAAKSHKSVSFMHCFKTDSIECKQDDRHTNASWAKFINTSTTNYHSPKPDSGTEMHIKQSLKCQQQIRDKFDKKNQELSRIDS
jgi:hypothetical protein